MNGKEQGKLESCRELINFYVESNEGEQIVFGLMDLQQTNDRINKEVLLQLIIHCVITSRRLLNGINSMYVDSKVCLRINSVE